MGWNSWNSFACNITADDIAATADFIKTSGLSDLGYEYINVDDCWMGTERGSCDDPADNKTCHMQIAATFATEKYPTMKSLVDYVHSKDLKFGLYSSAGTMTCE
jgi:alpha-galactosidase